MHHVFVSNEIAKTVWIHFELIVDVYSTASVLQLKINDWWLYKAMSPYFKEVLSFVPTCIVVYVGNSGKIEKGVGYVETINFISEKRIFLKQYIRFRSYSTHCQLVLSQIFQILIGYKWLHPI